MPGLKPLVPRSAKKKKMDTIANETTEYLMLKAFDNPLAMPVEAENSMSVMARVNAAIMAVNLAPNLSYILPA